MWMVVGLVLLSPVRAFSQEEVPAYQVLGDALQDIFEVLRGDKGPYVFSIEGKATGGSDWTADLRITYVDDVSYVVRIGYGDMTASLIRADNAVALLVPSKSVMLLSEKGERSEEMDASALVGSIIQRAPGLQGPADLVRSGGGQSLAILVHGLLGLTVGDRDETGTTLVSDPERENGEAAFRIEEGKLKSIKWSDGERHVVISLSLAAASSVEIPEVAEGVKIVSVSREELEPTIARALARAAEILWRDRFYAPPASDEVVSGKGRLVVEGGNRVLHLAGTAEEIGYQHGVLLAPEVKRLVELVLYVGGLYYAIDRGEWFPDALRSAWKRLGPHVDEEYVAEMKGLAEGAGLDEEEVLMANIYPEFFHCSGFALTGKATAGGKLYHGRVLDYMTRIGLQRAAVVIVSRKEGRIPFANVSYAGFIGSVSGMNAEGIAIGEMGGGGVGQWDGVPMSFLVRGALERCGTLDEVKRHFKESPRTCEYYYVVSSGKEKSGFGVRAVPEEVVFVEMGQAHARLPRAVADCVIFSAGSRYETLVDRVEARYGQIDEQKALELMRRPVAMSSNLHNVLFVPEDLVFHVANASGRGPACDQPYARYDLGELLRGMDVAEKREGVAAE